MRTKARQRARRERTGACPGRPRSRIAGWEENRIGQISRNLRRQRSWNRESPPTSAKGTAPESITPAMHKETCPASKGIGLRDFEAIDGRWLEALTLYANARGPDGITPFWTTTFFTYVESSCDGLSDEYNSRVEEAIRRQGRTDTFRAFQALSERYGKRGRQ